MVRNNYRIMNKRKLWPIILLGILLLGYVSINFRNYRIVWDISGPNHQVMRLMTPEAMANQKTILLWNSVFGDDWFQFGDTWHFNNCSMYNNCFVTRERGFLPIRQYAAIFFHEDEIDPQDIPSDRDLRQEYVFVNIEGRRNRPSLDSYFNDYFNMTMSYRLDGDIPWPRYIVQNIDTGQMVAPHQNVNWIEPSHDTLRWKTELQFDEKKKMAAWLVTNCETYGTREFFVNEMERVMKVDRIGKCGKTTIPQCVTSTDECFTQIIEPDYFFYLSFEDSLCQDYVSEKFFNALSHNVIPVVYGGANYSLFAPPYSYIDALDFKNPEALALFLIDLSQDKEEYLKYFWWKRFYTVTPSRDWSLCNICKLLNLPKEPKTYSHLSDWYLKNKCTMQDHMNSAVHAINKLQDLAWIEIADSNSSYEPLK